MSLKKVVCIHFSPQNLQLEKQAGQKLLTLTLESSEKLYPALSTELRDSVHQSIRTIQQQWENCCDISDDVSNTAEKERKMLVELERRCSDIGHWLQSFEEKLDAGDQRSMNSLSEKKNAVRSQTVSGQDFIIKM